MGIKKEKTDTVPKPAPQKPVVKSNAWNEENHKLLDKIASLQSENQRTVLQLKAKEAECTAQTLDKQNMHQKFSDQMSSLSNENSSLRIELLTTKNELNASKKTISNLKSEKQKLSAVIKQLKTGSTQSNASHFDHDDSIDNNFYEVEKLLKHKIKKDGVYYLVRWKNFSADDDTWQKECDLQCPNFLNEYKRRMKMNRN